jgi:DNA-binding beta-propeller fold protein YncE
MVFAQIEVIDTVAVESGPRGVAYNADNGFMYVTNTFSDTVSIIGIIVTIADAGPDQSVDSGATVQLDGTGSSTNGGSPIASYQWTQTQGPTVTLDDPTSATPSFTAPKTLVEENIVFELVVTNELGVESQPDSVTITVNHVTPVPPLEGIIGSGNNINIQVQENTGNNAIGQAGSGNGQMYSDESIFQGQSTEQDSSVIS